MTNWQLTEKEKKEWSENTKKCLVSHRNANQNGTTFRESDKDEKAC